jgi:hypothetical protein
MGGSALTTGAGTPWGATGSRGSLSISNPGNIMGLGDAAAKLDPTSYMGIGNGGNWGASQTISNLGHMAGNGMDNLVNNTATNAANSLGGDWQKNNFLDPAKSDAGVAQGNANAQAQRDSQTQMDQANQAQTQATQAATDATNKQNGITDQFNKQNDLENALMNARKKSGTQVYQGF